MIIVLNFFIIILLFSDLQGL